MLWTQQKPELEHIPHDIKKIQDFVTNYSKQKKKAMLIHGPTGTGKTATIHAIARKYDLELVEINASDYRTADEIEQRIGNALKQQSLFAQQKLILVDEVDGIAGREDRGGIKAITDLMKDSKYPIILTANDPFDSKFSTLRTKSQMIEFPALSMTQMTPILQRILQNENKKTEDSLLKTIAVRSGGDLRGAITDMQTLTLASALTAPGINTLHERQRTETIQQALIKILKTTDPRIALSALDMIEEDIDETILWLDENLPKEYKNPQDLARAYDALSKADVYRGRIRKWQYWRYLAYVNVLITAGIATAKDKKTPGMADYTRTQRILKIWMANQKYLKRKKIAAKLGTAMHCSAKKALQTLPHIQKLYKTKHPSAIQITSELDLDEEEVEWMEK